MHAWNELLFERWICEQVKDAVETKWLCEGQKKVVKMNDAERKVRGDKVEEEEEEEERSMTMAMTIV